MGRHWLLLFVPALLLSSAKKSQLLLLNLNLSPTQCQDRSQRPTVSTPVQTTDHQPQPFSDYLSISSTNNHHQAIMAILNSLPGIEATVVVDGEALTEYDTENDNVTHTNPAAATHQQACTITKYIEAATDKTFLVRLIVKAPYRLDCPHLSFEVLVDGQRVSKPLMSKRKYATGSWSTIVDGVRSKINRHFSVTLIKFAEIQTTDEASDSATLKVHKSETDKLGEIVILVHRRSAGTTVKFKGNTFNGLGPGKEYHEKVLSKEGKSHGVILGDEKSSNAPHIMETTAIDGKDFPIAIFRFKYRSAHALQNLQILPRDDSVNVAENEAAVQSEDDELRDLDPELRDRMKKLLARVKGGIEPAKTKAEPKIEQETKIKPEPKIKPESKIKQESKIKRHLSDSEEDVKPLKKAKVTKKKQIGKCTIDLTEDSDTEVPIVSLD